MQGWWRVLRGAWPYRWSVIISIICAFGVGLSYAAGVGVMLPVMKIFTSVEGVHGWANREGADKRLNVQILDLDTTVRRTEKKGKDEYGLIVSVANAGAAEQLKPVGEVNRRINRVQGRAPDRDGEVAERDVTGWQEMIRVIAHAEPGSTLTLHVADVGPVPVTANELSWHTRMFVNVIDLLPTQPTQALIAVVLFFIVLCVIGSIFRYFQQHIGMSIANRVVMDLRRRMYDRVVALPTSYFARKGTSDLMSRLTADTGTLTEGVAMAFGKAIQEPIKAVGAFGLAMWLDWRLCLLVVLSMPLLGIIIHKFSKRMRRASRRALESWSGMLAVINETLIGARVVKAYSAEGYERRRFARVNKQLLKEQIRMNHYNALSRPTIETLAIVLTSIPMVFAAHMVLQGKIDREAFFTILACFAAMLEPVRKLSDVNAKVQHTNAASARVFEIIDTPSEPNHNHSLPKLPRHRESIEFRDITFSYPGHDEVVLKNINVKIAAGRNVAIVGGNGSGKTTLLNLLPRLYVPTSGSVLIDGVDISTVSLRSLRKQIGLVTQDTLLFADTIYNNIAYGTRHATQEQVVEAARRAYADEFISTFPDGYQTMVGEHGMRLSGGQKQRIAIARAILHDPTILILDEAMSQIDSDSEMKITLALREFTVGRTVLMIAHRFQTVINSDLIICLDAGRVAGVGKHDELLATCLPYRRLYENQFREAS